MESCITGTGSDKVSGKGLAIIKNVLNFQGIINYQHKNAVGTQLDTQYFYAPMGTRLTLIAKAYVIKEKVVDGEVVSYVDYESLVNTYDTATGCLNEEFDIPENFFNASNCQQVLEFALSVFASNPYVENYLLNSPFESPITTDSFNSKNTKKVYELFVKNPTLAENILKTNPTLLCKNLEFLDVTKKNLKTSVGLPATVLDFLKNKKLTALIPDIQGFCEDGNDAVIVMDFLSSLKTITKSARKLDGFYHSVLSRLKNVREKDNSYLPKDVLKYVLTQTMFNGDWTMEGLKETCQLFKDYVNMKVDMQLFSEDNYPSNIVEAHDLLDRNTKSINPEMESKFQAAVAGYKKYSTTISVKIDDTLSEKYVVLVPSCQKDLIVEGSKLHHCVGTYSQRVIDGVTRILFLRKEETPDEPLATIEIDDNGNVLQAKGSFNENVEGSLEKAVKEYQKFSKAI